MSGLTGLNKHMKKDKAANIKIIGRVQGVGFRPFVFSLAEKYSIRGTVQNNMDGVKIYAEGCQQDFDNFIRGLYEQQPRLARIDHISVDRCVVQNVSGFSIINSERSGSSTLVIPVDAAICDDCRNEMNDRTNFRYQYPFINCTQCGPRYTIIQELPYDRPYTTMKDFQMCETCQSEYVDPVNRRHHAQPIACPKCGPTVKLLYIDGEVLVSDNDALVIAAEKLTSGKIVAIKGIGGFHLACNASDEKAVQRLRTRKKRPNRPLAVMGNELESLETIAFLSKDDRKWLHSPEAPIVVAKRKETNKIASLVAPHMSTIGVFLPYTPLHELLFQSGAPDYLVMTSANPSGLPMLYKDQEAQTYLSEIADLILTTNREIIHPIDDSVIKIENRSTHFFRRARGFVPDPLQASTDVHGVVALGSQQKNTFAFGRYNQIFVGPHIGDMGNVEVSEHFVNEFNHLKKWMGIEPQVCAIDLHPSYETSQLAIELGFKDIIKVQHHHAHHVSCMEENNRKDPSFGIILDGTGFGEDGHIWGFELLYGNAKSYQRLGHLAYHPLPGSERAVKEPWRNAVGMILSYLGDVEGKALAKEIFPNKISEIEIIAAMLMKKINSPLAGTCGRLFDAISAICGLCEVSTYDGEAAIKLSELVDGNEVCNESYPFYINDNHGLLEIDPRPMLLEILQEVHTMTNSKKIALKFHETVVEMCVQLIMKATEKKTYQAQEVVLSGGSFHNKYLLSNLKKRLENRGFCVYTHSKVPCNDGGLSLGQVIIANERFKREGK